MIPFGAVQVPGFSRRRNRQKLIEELKRARERAEMNQIEREVETSDVVNKAVEKGLPSEMADLVKHQLGVLTTGFMPEVPNEETWKRNELDQLADRFAGYYLEKKADGWNLLDFGALVECSPSIRYFDSSVTITFEFTGGGSTAITGDAALAFIRYLHFIGLFEVENAKRPCPECGDKIPQNCETCGGLGWVID
jgi:hypothetical protein